MVIRTSDCSNSYIADEMIRNTNAEISQFFHNLDQKSQLGRYEKNMTFTDWGGVMKSRSYGKDRIVDPTFGGAHYGLDGRLLEIQQLTHELVKNE